jgi:ankyrin repeat protein
MVLFKMSCKNIIYVCEKGDEKALSMLLHAGAFVDLRANSGNTALTYACDNGNTECVSMLLHTGASIDIQDNHGFTALICACKNGNKECVSMLLHAGASIDIQTISGYTGLMIACDKGNKECVLMLLHIGASVDIQTSYGDNCYDVATEECKSILLRHSIDMACTYGTIDDIIYLLKRGKKTSIRNDKYREAMKRYDEECKKIEEELIKYGYPNVLGKLISRYI